MKITTPKLLISGCGRSGTKYIAELLKSLGVNASHEVPDPKFDVVIDWHLISYNKFYDTPMIHQVRNPLDTISSATKIYKVSWEIISEKIPIKKSDSVLLKSMKYYYYWNKLAEEKSLYTYRIENIENEIEKILKLIDIKEYDKSIIESISKETNSRKHTDYSWDALKKVDLSLTNKIIELGKSYGYEIKN